MQFWERIKSLNLEHDDPYYGVMRLAGDGMEALRQLFPDGVANDLNFVLFSTSGVHGTYCTLEDAESEGGDVTFLVVQPRIVGLRYGNCTPKTQDDFQFLRRLRESSHLAASSIGSKQGANHD